MIDRALMLKWIDALRSGKYTQTVGFMRTPEGFDPMGVLLDIIDSEGWGEPFTPAENWPSGKAYIPYKYEGNIYTFQLPYSVADSLGLYDSDMFNLIEMNDKRCLDFEQIADYMERMYLVS